MDFKLTNHLPEDAKQLRIEIFVDEQGFEEEFDEIDDISIHVVCYKNNLPIATGRTFKKDDNTYKIGRIAVKKEFRGQNLGFEIIKKIEEVVLEQGALKTALSSQYQAFGFYEKCGYKIVGEPYLEENAKHIYMEKTL